MLREREIVTEKELEIIENIKRDILMQLVNKGVIVSGLDMKISPDNISLNISIKSSRRFI